jgi:hypothetical protein
MSSPAEAGLLICYIPLLPQDDMVRLEIHADGAALFHIPTQILKVAASNTAYLHTLRCSML